MTIMPPENHPHIRRAALVFWLVVMGLLALLVPLVLLAGISPADAPTLSAVVGVAIVLYALHAADLQRHKSEIQHDPHFRHDRERRGF